MSYVPPGSGPGYAPPRKSKTGLIIGILVATVLGGCLLFCGVGGFFMYRGMQAVGPAMSCGMTFTAVNMALLQYARENEGRLPPADTWQDEIAPLVEKKAKEMRDFPFASISLSDQWGCETGDPSIPKTGIALNTEVAGKLTADLKPNEITVFEIEAPRRNASEPYRKRDEQTSPRLMGQPRGWIAMTVDGNMIGLGGGRRPGRVDLPGKSSEKMETEAP